MGRFVQHIAIRFLGFHNSIDLVVGQMWFAFSKGQCTVCSSLACLRLICFNQFPVCKLHFRQLKFCIRKHCLCIVLIQLEDFDFRGGIATGGTAHTVRELFILYGTATRCGIPLPVGVVGNGDGLPWGCVDGDGVSNGQGLVIR